MANNQLKEEIILSTSKFDSNINSVIKKVEELKAKGSKVGDGFNTSMGSLIRVVGKFSGALGIAVSAGEVFNKMMSQSQSLGDAVQKAQYQAAEAVNFFATSLANADFGGFISGLKNIISLAGDAAEAMDRAASIGLRFGWTNQSKLGAYNKAMAEARNPENSKEDRLKYLGQAKQISEQLKKGEDLKSKADLDAAFETIRTELSKQSYNGKRLNKNWLTNNRIRKLFDVKNFAHLEKMHDEMKEALDGVVLTNTKYGANGAHLAKADQNKFASSSTRLAAWAANEIDDSPNSPLGKALQMIGAADDLVANQAEREAQQAKLGQKIDKAGKDIKTNTKKTSGSGGGKTDYAIGSIGYYEELISELHKKIKIETDTNKLLELQNQLKEAVRLKGRLEDIGFTNRQAEVGKNIQTTGLGTLFQIPNETAEQITKELQEKIAKNPIQIIIDVSLTQKRIEAIGDALYNLGSIMESLGGMFDNTVLDASGIIAQAVANYILGWTEATKQASLLGPIGWAAFGLSTAAQMFAVVAQIKSAGAFANGGVVGGSSYAGDNLYARVNSGEAILNTNQQKHLFTLLDGNHNQITGGNVEFVIKGSSLHGVLKNYDNKLSKIK